MGVLGMALKHLLPAFSLRLFCGIYVLFVVQGLKIDSLPSSSDNSAYKALVRDQKDSILSFKVLIVLIVGFQHGVHATEELRIMIFRNRSIGTRFFNFQ